MKHLLLLGALLYTMTTSAQAKWGWGMKRNWSIGFYTENGNINKDGDQYDNVFAVGLDVGAYLLEERNLLVGLDFGFGNTRYKGGRVSPLYGKTVVGNQHLRAITGFKFNNWLQVRGGVGIGGVQEYNNSTTRATLESESHLPLLGTASGWNTESILSWKGSVLLGPVELGWSNNGLLVGIKFIR